jgi:methionyl aminopeptidase
MAIIIKTPQEIEAMQESGKILAAVFDIVKDNFKPGINAKQLDDLIFDAISSHQAKPSFLGYQGYKYSSCISKNEEVVHGIPYKEKIFMPGDIASIDIGVFFKGFHSDAARTLWLEPIPQEVTRLITVTEECFFKAIEHAKPGNTIGDMTSALQHHAESNGFSVVRDLCSHGIGKKLHEDPLIPNYGVQGKGFKLKEGMTFAIEPMINMGTHQVLTLDDKWTIITADQKLSAHYENTICITKDGAKILTRHVE